MYHPACLDVQAAGWAGCAQCCHLWEHFLVEGLQGGSKPGVSDPTTMNSTACEAPCPAARRTVAGMHVESEARADRAGRRVQGTLSARSPSAIRQAPARRTWPPKPGVTVMHSTCKEAGRTHRPRRQTAQLKEHSRWYSLRPRLTGRRTTAAVAAQRFRSGS